MQPNLKNKAQNTQFLKQLANTQLGKFINTLTIPSIAFRQFQTITSMQDIKKLYLCNEYNITGRKNITEIPILSQLKNLQTLWLSINNIQSVNNLYQCNNLKELYLNNNAINQLIGFEYCSKLQKLNLANNKIGVIYKQLSLPPTLHTLILSNNQLTSVECLSYLQISLLQTLYLSSNHIINARCLRRLNCQNLKNIYLDNNKIIDFIRYDEIYIKNSGSIHLVNLQYTLNQVNTTVMKIGSIKGPRARCKQASIIFK